MKFHLIKRSLLAALFCLMPLFSMAQGIYTKFEHYDKFDEVIASKDVKTIIARTDSTFIFETRGEEPVVYACTLLLEEGSEEEPANITSDLYGIDRLYVALTPQLVFETAAALNITDLDGINDQMESYLEELKKRAPIITWRTVSKYRYTYEYRTDLIWIRFPDGSRYIYSKY